MPGGLTSVKWWRAAPWLSLVAGAVVFGSTLLSPFFHDDRVQRAMAMGTFPAPRGAFDLYDFVRSSERARFVDLGVLPWWTADEFNIRFFRPLASVLLFAEHRWLGSATAMHALSLLWWGAAVLSAGWLFRRTLTPRAAAFATIIFALAPGQEPALALLAQREVLVTLTFGTLALVALCREEPMSWRRALLAGVLFALSLAAGEYGLCLGGYVLAQALLQRVELRARLWRIAPFAGVAAAYLVVRAALGYSAVGSAFYRDPIHAPGVFVAHAPRSALAILADAWSTFDTETLPTWLLLALGVVLVAILARATPRDGALRWLVAGSFLAVVPLLASTPGQRLVPPVLLGVAPALGALADHALATRRVWSVAAALAMGALHLVHGPASSWSLSRGSLHYAREQSRRARDLEALTAAAPANVVGLASLETAFFTGVSEHERDRGARRTHVLVTARHALVLRVDARTIDVVVPKGNGFFPVGADSMYRAEDDPLPSGAERDVTGVHIRVVSGGETSAPRIRFTFEQDLESSAGWLTETRAGFEALALPGVGYGVQLSP